MNKYIMRILSYQCSFPENTNNLKESTEPQQEKTQTEVVLSQQNPIMEAVAEKTNLRRKKNPFVKNKILDKLKKHFIFFLVFVVLLISFCFYIFHKFLPQHEQEKNKEEESFPEEFEWFNNETIFSDEDFVEEQNISSRKKMFLGRLRNTTVFALFEKKQNCGKKTYHKYKKSIFFNAFFLCGQLSEILLEYFQVSQKTIKVRSWKLIKIDYDKIIESIQNHYIFFSPGFIFFSGNFLQIEGSYDFNKKKEEYRERNRITKSKTDFFKIRQFLAKQAIKVIKTIPKEQDLTLFITKIIKIYPQKKEIKNIKKYGFIKNGEYIPSIIMSYQVQKALPSSIGAFFLNFFLFLRKKENTDIKIITKEEKEIKVKQETFLEISDETINFFEKELENLFFIDDRVCYTVFETGNYTLDYLLEDEKERQDLLEKTKKLQKKQETKAKEYIRKHPVTGPMEKTELVTFMKGCLLNTSELQKVPGLRMKKIIEYKK